MGRRTTGTVTATASMAALALVSVAAFAQNNLTDLGAVAPGLGINNSDQVVLLNYFYGSGTLTAFPANFTGAGINSNGQVVGAATPQSTCPPPLGQWGVSPCLAVWAGGTLTLYPGHPGSDGVGNYGLGINSSGQIVGYWNQPLHDYTGAILFSNSVYTDLHFTYPPGGACPILYPASTFGAPNYAYAINDAGQIAGQASRWNVNQTALCVEAFFYSQGLFTDIGPGAALALNATGQVVGVLQSQPTVAHAFLYDPSGGGPAKDLGTLPGGNSSYAYAINAPGLIVGTSSTQPGNNPVLPDDSTHPYKLPYPSSPSNFTAFFYNGVMIDLNALVSSNDPLQPFVRLTDARGINDSGLIIVNGVDSRTEAEHAYLLQAPMIQVAPGPLSFPSEPIGSTSAPQTLTFTNIGATALALGTAAISGGYTIQSNNCGSTLAPAAACMISVAFAPTASASPAGTLTLPAGGVPIAVPLSTALTVSITSSSSTTTTGTPVTLTWNATPGTSCTATGGSSSDGWTGALAASGSKAVTETTLPPGTNIYNYGITCTAGAQTQSAQVAVAVSWAPVALTLTASPTTLYTGQSTTLTWSAQNATTCASSGGGSNDGWPNSSRPASGSVPITEPNPVITGGSETLTFTLTCTSSLSNLSGTSSVKIVQLDTPPPSKGGGGGAFDPLALVFLLGVLAAQAGCSTPLHSRALRISAGTDRLKRNQTN